MIQFFERLQLIHIVISICRSEIAGLEIAGMAGFYSNAYFIRAFKNRFGITPKEMIVKEGQ